MPTTLTYSPLLSQTHAECLRINTCGYARYAEPTTSAISVGDSATHCVHYSSFIIHHSSLSFTFSAKERDSGADGKLSYEGTANTEIDMLISQAVDNENIVVNTITGKDRDFGDGNVVKYGGGYGGNYYEDGNVCTEQFVCPSLLATHDLLVGDSKTGLTMIHELAESFYGGTIALSQEQSSPQSRYENSTYPQAHAMANKIAVGDFSHHPLFSMKKPSNIDDKTARIFIPHIEIWERGQNNVAL